MSEENPFAVSVDPSLARARVEDPAETVEVTKRTITLLLQTRPWVRFLGVMMWIGVAFLALLAILMAVGAAASPEPILMLMIAGMYVAMLLPYCLMAYFLSAYASRITSLKITEQAVELESALQAQKSLWKTAGISVLVGIVLYVAMIAVFVGLVISGADPDVLFNVE